MKIKLLKHYGMSGPGEIIDPAKPIATLLIGRGMAKKAPKKRTGAKK